MTSSIFYALFLVKRYENVEKYDNLLTSIGFDAERLKSPKNINFTRFFQGFCQIELLPRGY